MTSSESRDPAASAPEHPRIEIVRGAPDEDELAALLAVVSDAYERELSEAVADETRVSAWRRTGRGIRSPLRRDIPWGRYRG